MKLVLVDDSVMILKHAEQILRNSDLPVEILTCQSGKELLEICNEQEVDIVLLDIVMPNMDGFEVLKRIKQSERLRSIEVLMFSSLSDKEILRDCFELGATDYIAKPIVDLEFNARINSVIRKKNFEKEGIRYLKEIQEHNAELQAVNAKLQDAHNQLIQQEKLASVGHLAAGVAHEINNPLGFVTSNVSTLRKYTEKYRVMTELAANVATSIEMENLNPEALIPLRAMKDCLNKSDFEFINEDIDELFKDTTEGLERVGKIVKGLRNFSRIDQTNDFSLYNLNEGIENTLIISRNEIKYAAEVKLELGELPEINASGGQINQVILNMLLNAASAVKIKFGNRMGAIVIKTWADEGFVHMTISDNGVGIAPEHISTVFNPFFTTKPVGEGTGLGLSIGYDIIVNKHRGKIWVTSQVGEGTEFHIVLPVAPVDDLS